MVASAAYDKLQNHVVVSICDTLFCSIALEVRPYYLWQPFVLRGLYRMLFPRPVVCVQVLTLFREGGAADRMFATPVLQNSLVLLFRLPTGPAEDTHLQRVAQFLERVRGFQTSAVSLMATL